MTGRRGDCSSCSGGFALRSDGNLRHHAPPSGIVGIDRCDGGGKPPRTWADPPKDIATVVADAMQQVHDNPRPTWKQDPYPPQMTVVMPEVVYCDHLWSGWTRLPTTELDFRQCWWCWTYETQERQPCALCAGAGARCYEVPGYGTAYVCQPCMEAL